VPRRIDKKLPRLLDVCQGLDEGDDREQDQEDPQNLVERDSIPARVRAEDHGAKATEI